jgi:CBS-domain-containing membrane protein
LVSRGAKVCEAGAARQLNSAVRLGLFDRKHEPLMPQDSLERAIEVFAENDLQEVPVVNARPDNKLVGMVRRTDIARAYLRRVHADKTQVE